MLPGDGAVERGRVAIVTGGSRGLGRALAGALAERGWDLVLDARGEAALRAVEAELQPCTHVTAVPGDVADEAHARALVEAARMRGGLNLLVNNASVLGPSPQPRLVEYPLEELERVYRINVLAPLRLIQLAVPLLEASKGRIINVTSDAAAGAYEGWGGYGSSKAALEQISNVLAAELSGVKVFWVDPGDMNTEMQREAYPGEDISDRPPPEESVPGLLTLIEGDAPSGRYEARALAGDRT
jgi:NAD(P)-dependent dehydrogenase (short-subunit alcohol dehydrogenase family)